MRPGAYMLAVLMISGGVAVFALEGSGGSDGLAGGAVVAEARTVDQDGVGPVPEGGRQDEEIRPSRAELSVLGPVQEQQEVTGPEELAPAEAPIFDAATQRISFQALLTDGLGNPLADGPHTLDFFIYDAAVGGALIGSTLNVAVVISDGNGVVSTQVQVDPSWFDGSARYLGVTVDDVDDDPTGDELSPRIPLTAVPYALRVDRVLSEELDDNIELGSASANGSLRVYRTGSSTKAIELIGSASRISTYGSDGLEQIRLWGPSWGEIFLYDQVGNDQTVALSATSDSGGQLSLFDPGGALRAVLSGSAAGANFILYDGSTDATVSLRGDLGGRIDVEDSFKVVDALGGTVLGELVAASYGGRVWTYDEAGVTTSFHGSSVSAGGLSYIYQASGGLGLELDGDRSGADGGGLIRAYQGDGAIGVEIDGDQGGAGQIDVRNSDGLTRVRLVGESTGTAGEISVFDADGTETVQILSAETSTTGAEIKLYKADGTKTIEIDADYNGDGRIITQELQITGGSDLSEQFDIRSVAGEVQPGMVVCIDPARPGKLVVSSRSYDRTVAGVVSGAGGLEPGMLMGQRGTEADGQHAVALAGRVWVWCTGSNGPIRPGDLLTTSEVAGHAMRVTDYSRAHGAILGKAMTGLAADRGLVLALVALQ